MWLKQSTAYTFRLGPFVDDTDGKTAETGLTLTQADFRLSKAGGAFAQKNDATSGTHDENGYYQCVLNTTDTNTLGTLDINVSESGALPVFRSFMVVPANVWDSFFGADLLQVDVQQFGNSNGTFSSGRPEVNTTHAAGTAWGSGAITAASIADNAIDADALAADAGTEIATAVWAAGTRSLTVLDEDSTTLDLDATIRSAVGMAAANLDTQLTGINTNIDANEAKIDIIDTNVDAILVDTGTDIPALIDALPTAAENTTAVWGAAARTLTALDEDSTTIDLDTTIRAATGQASANLDTQFAAVNTNIDANETKIDTVETKIDTVDTVLDALVADIGANGSGLTAIPWNASWDAEVQSEVNDGLIAYDAATGTDVSGITPPTVDAIADEIETRVLDANIVRVNDVTVDGSGTEADPWGP